MSSLLVAFKAVRGLPRRARMNHPHTIARPQVKPHDQYAVIKLTAKCFKKFSNPKGSLQRLLGKLALLLHAERTLFGHHSCQQILLRVNAHLAVDVAHMRFHRLLRQR